MAKFESNFYQKAAEYWASIPPTIDGVLGGFGHVSDIDIEGSRLFLHQLFELPQPPNKRLALDCGAGIGRVSKLLLIPHFQNVDLVEQDEKFAKAAKDIVGEGNERLGKIYNKSLLHFTPKKIYDVIWCQWVLGHLKDYDLIDFLKRCKGALAKDGVIVVKENITNSSEIEYDEDDSSVTRPRSLMMEIFKHAELELIKENEQNNFPDDIYPVHMFALVPATAAHQCLNS